MFQREIHNAYEACRYYMMPDLNTKWVQARPAWVGKNSGVTTGGQMGWLLQALTWGAEKKGDCYWLKVSTVSVAGAQLSVSTCLLRLSSKLSHPVHHWSGSRLGSAWGISPLTRQPLALPWTFYSRQWRGVSVIVFILPHWAHGCAEHGVGGLMPWASARILHSSSWKETRVLIVSETLLVFLSWMYLMHFILVWIYS